MKNSIYQALGIQPNDNRKLGHLGPIFFLTGLAYVAGILSSQSLFVSRFGVAYLPLMYLVEAAILPLQLWLISFLSQKMPPGKMIRGLFLIILAGMVCGALFAFGMAIFHFQWRGFYPLLFILSSVLLRILVPLMWMLGNGICLLQQAKRLFPVLSALFTLGAAFAGFLARIAPAFFAGIATETVLLIVPIILFLSFFLWRSVIANYFLTKELKVENERNAPMKTVIKTVWAIPLLRITLLSFIILMSLYYITDYQFFMFATRRFPASDDLTRFYGIFTAILYLVSFLVSLLLNRLLKSIGIGKTVLAMGIVTVVVLAGSGLMAQSRWPLPGFVAADLIIDVLSFTLLPMINEVFYKLLPVEFRAGTSLLFAGSINAVGKLLSSAVTGAHSAQIVPLIGLSLTAFIMACGYFLLTSKQKRLYLSTLLESLQSHVVSVTELESLSPGKLLGKNDLRPLEAAFHSTDSTKQLIALELGAQIRNEALFPSIEPFLAHPDPQKRLLAYQAIPDNLPGLEEYGMRALRDQDAEIRCEAVRRLALHLPDGRRLGEIIGKLLDDSSPSVVRETMIALCRNSDLDPDLEKRIQAQIQTLLRGDAESRFQVCQVIQTIKAVGYEEPVREMLRQESSRVRIAAAKCLGGLGSRAAVPLLLNSYSNADRELKKEIENALLEIGGGAVDQLVKSLDRKDIDTWYLSVITLAALDQDRQFEKLLSRHCDLKLKSLRKLNEIPPVLEGNGMGDLASLYRSRIAENRAAILEACWKTLAVYFDPIVVNRLKPALAQESSTEKREQGVEILAELSQRHPVTAEMASVLHGEAPAAPEQPLNFYETIQKAKQEFSDHWLDLFSDYAMAHHREGSA